MHPRISAEVRKLSISYIDYTIGKRSEQTAKIPFRVLKKQFKLLFLWFSQIFSRPRKSSSETELKNFQLLSWGFLNNRTNKKTTVTDWVTDCHVT